MRRVPPKRKTTTLSAYSYSPDADHSPLAALGFAIRNTSAPENDPHHIIHRVHNGHHDPVGSPQPDKTISTPHGHALTVPEQALGITLRHCCSMTGVQIFTTLGVQPDTAQHPQLSPSTTCYQRARSRQWQGSGRECDGHVEVQPVRKAGTKAWAIEIDCGMIGIARKKLKNERVNLGTESWLLSCFNWVGGGNPGIRHRPAPT